MDNFAQTRMGHEFFDGTMKSINKNLARIADALEALVAAQQVEPSESPADTDPLMDPFDECK